MRARRRSPDVLSLVATVVVFAGCTPDSPDRVPIASPDIASPRAMSSPSGIQVQDLGEPSTGGPFSDVCPAPDVPPGPGNDGCVIGLGLRGVAINQKGTVAIQGHTSIVDRLPLLWERGTFTALDPAADGRQWRITAVNNAGEAAGYVLSSDPGAFSTRAVRFSGGVATLLPNGAGNIVLSRAWGINEQGDIVGSVMVAAEVDGFVLRATLWRRTGEVVDLGALDPGRGSEAYAVNNLGEAVGISGSNELSGGPSPSQSRAVRPVKFEKGRVVDLGGSRSCAGEAYAVNDAGQAAGKLCDRATLWDTRGAVPLETPLGARESAAFGINNSGDVVGRIVFPENAADPYRNYLIETPGLEEPFVLSILHDPLDVVPAWWHRNALTVLPMLDGQFRPRGVAYAVNNQGQIAGVNLVVDRSRAVLWTVNGPTK